MPDLTQHMTQAAMKIVAGTARSMGVLVEECVENDAKIIKTRQTDRLQSGKRRLHNLDEAIDLIKSVKATKFDETVELSMRLGLIHVKQTRWFVEPAPFPVGLGKTSGARFC